MMSNIYFTITGLHHYYGNEFLEKEMVVYLKKDKDNDEAPPYRHTSCNIAKTQYWKGFRRVSNLLL